MSSHVILDPVILPLVNGNKVLDVGCGNGKWGALLTTCWWCTNASVNSPRYIIGIDIWLPSLKKAKHCRVYDDVILCDALHLPLQEKCFDIVLACEILEHISKENGPSFLKEIERVGSKTVVVTVPRFLFGKGNTWVAKLRETNIYEKHVASWNKKELERCGYRVYYNLFASLSFGFGAIGKWLASIVRKIPWFSTHLIALKNLADNYDIK